MGNIKYNVYYKINQYFDAFFVNPRWRPKYMEVWQSAQVLCTNHWVDAKYQIATKSDKQFW